MLVRSALGWPVLALILTIGPPRALAENEAKSAGELPATPTHRRGGRPAVPQDRLPDDVPLPPPNENARHAIAEGPTVEELQAGPVDAELSALQQAERVLFSRQLSGVQNGWSFDASAISEEDDHGLGLPFVTPPTLESPVLPEADVAWLRGLTLPDLPIVLDRRVVTYLKFYRDSQQGRSIATIWTQKSGRYVAEMKAQLRRAGLPTDLVWLSMIESGHNPTIQSPAGAVGLWQFMPESGRMYGLVVDRWVDERRDPARSTQAAVRFLSDLYRRFGNWELSMAAYNMGYAGMSRAIAKYSTNDFWALSRMESGIPWETSLYVPKIFALAIVMNNRAAFGVGRTKLDPPVSFDTILLEPATKLQAVAQAAQMPMDELRRLNPQFLTDRLPPEPPLGGKKWSLHVPRGKGTTALGKLGSSKDKHRLYRTRLGDTIDTVASDYQVSLNDLSELNDLIAGEALEEGTVLLMPIGAQARNTSGSILEEIVVGRAALPGSGQRRVFYRVTGIDTLSQVAAAFAVKETDLCRWNLLNVEAHLREGMSLQVLVDQAAQFEAVRIIEESQALVLVAGSPEFHDHFEGLKGKQRVTITVKEGETLAGVGARYGMTVGSMERVNRRSRREKLVPGEFLIVYTDKKLSANSSAWGAEPLPALPESAP